MIDGIAGVILWTDDLDKLKLFYINKLGLKPHSVQEGFIAFDFDGIRLSIGLHSAVKGDSKDPLRVMVNLGTNRIWAIYNKMVEDGVIFLRPPEVQHWGGMVATFEDPDGNVLQLMQQPKCSDDDQNVNIGQSEV